MYCASALAIQAVGPRLSARARELCWRLVAVKLAGVAIMMVAIAGGCRLHVIGFTQASHAHAVAAVVGVVVGLLWLTALGLATTMAWVWLRDRTLPSPPPNPWITRTASTVAAGFIATIGVLATGAAS